MKFKAYYFICDNHHTFECDVVASSRIEAIDLFDELYPDRRLISLVPTQ